MVIDLVRSGGGAFEVVLDGRLLFSKKAVGRHCNHDEILEAIDS
jgi:selT/selW/selH-like putative selenoprotein